MGNLAVITELLEASTNACDNFIKSEMALNDGDIESCQKFSKNGQVLMKALLNDTFLEVKELFGESDMTEDYDYPNNFELIKSLNHIAMYVGSVLAAKDDENISKIAKNNLLRAINTASEIYKSLFEN